MSIFREFKEFIMRGNVVDLAVGVIIGAAFGKIVSSLVNDIIMPPIGKAMGGVNFADKYINLDPSKTLPNGQPITTLAEAKANAVAVITYGTFINNIIDFAIVAVCVFLMVKGVNTLTKKLAISLEATAAPPTPSELLLTEIRDLLKKQNETKQP